MACFALASRRWYDRSEPSAFFTPSTYRKLNTGQPLLPRLMRLFSDCRNNSLLAKRVSKITSETEKRFFSTRPFSLLSKTYEKGKSGLKLRWRRVTRWVKPLNISRCPQTDNSCCRYGRFNSPKRLEA